MGIKSFSFSLWKSFGNIFRQWYDGYNILSVDNISESHILKVVKILTFMSCIYVCSHTHIYIYHNKNDMNKTHNQ